jgi:REP element-mobilizing transposase RayT
MGYHRERHRRRSIRLKDYDYSQPGAYFITVCSHNHECIFGRISNGTMQLNTNGKIVQKCWDDLPNHYLNIKLGTFVIMPDHIHGIIFIENDPDDDVGAGLKPAPTKKSKPKRHALPEIVRAFKTFSSRRINECRNTLGSFVWQRSFIDRIIRDENELARIRNYILNNPLKWHLDKYNPDN